MATASTKRSGRAQAPVAMARIKAVAAQIARAVSPQRIILFGSYARGTTSPDSDVDLLVVTGHEPNSDASLCIRRKISYDFPLDLVVCSAARLARRMDEGDFFLRDAVERGKVLYEAPHR